MCHAQANDFTQRRRKLSHGFCLTNLFHRLLELQKGIHRLFLVGNLGVGGTIGVIANALVSAGVFKMQSAGVRAGESQEVGDGISALQIHDVGIAAL